MSFSFALILPSMVHTFLNFLFSRNSLRCFTLAAFILVKSSVIQLSVPLNSFFAFMTFSFDLRDKIWQVSVSPSPISDFNFCVVDIGGAKVQVTGHRLQVTGHRSLVTVTGQNKKYSWICGEFEFGSYLFFLVYIRYSSLLTRWFRPISLRFLVLVTMHE